MGALSIVQDAVVEHKLYISNEVKRLQILVTIQLGFDGAKVHGFLDDVEVVRDIELYRVHWLMEDPRVLVLEERINDPLRSLVPVVVQHHVVRHLLVLYIGESVGVLCVEVL